MAVGVATAGRSSCAPMLGIEETVISFSFYKATCRSVTCHRHPFVSSKEGTFSRHGAFRQHRLTRRPLR